MSTDRIYRLRSRRELLATCWSGIGSLALGSLMSGEARAATGNPLAPKAPHMPAKATSCIFLYMSGGTPQNDTFDYKPALLKYDGKPMPKLPGLDGEVAAFLRMPQKVLAPPHPLVQAGTAGRYISSMFPHQAECLDDLAFIHGIKMDSNNHAPATMQINTGSVLQGHPSVGAWVTYGLGTENQNMPGYVVLQDPRGMPVNGTAVWQSGFLPATYQGTPLESDGPPILDLQLPAGMERSRARRELDFLKALNERHASARPGADELEARISAYELAFRMQTEAPDIVDLSKEPESIRSMYGLDRPETAGFGRQCLLARRMVERGVRFVLAIHGWENGALSWDFHNQIRERFAARAMEIDQPIAALIKDLKQRGLFDETLVVWTSEMGRTPFVEAPAEPGRGHNQNGLITWFAGGGAAPGTSVGETDDFGLAAADQPIPLKDMHATILHLMGLNDMSLTHLHQGRYKRLTDTGGNVLRPILS